jgi:hypothetical protein
MCYDHSTDDDAPTEGGFAKQGVTTAADELQ